ncbi:unnamed protein product [Schistocephalus solidus]|uniref:Reverse transcriptase domain-containing protein n=1 Tax=Schistocephalus solidus TaxID=70667 RepID=A0A3P7EQ75_SCHSO|nr:unnamed protein product [Schistocephalus solidus]
MPTSVSVAMSLPTHPSSGNFLCDHCPRGFSSVCGRSQHMMSAHPAANFSERGRLAPSRTNWTAQADALLRSCASAVVKAAGPLALRALARKVVVKFPMRIVVAVFRRLSKLHKDEPLFALSGQLSPAGPTSPIPLTAPICLTDQAQCCQNSLLHLAVKLLTESPGQALASGDLLSLAFDLLMGEELLPEAAPRLDAHALCLSTTLATQNESTTNCSCAPHRQVQTKMGSLTERPSAPDQRPVSPPHAVDRELLDPISAADVTQNLWLMHGAAAGIDGLSARDQLQWSPGTIAGYLNVIQRLEQDGTAEVTSLLHGILRHAISAPRSIAVAVLDVAKAFDSVNHGTLLRAAETNGAPPLLLNLLTSFYSPKHTFKLGTEVRCQRGIRQCDPLCPLLFNCAFSEAITYSDRQLGFDLAGTTVDSITYADDLVLFAKSPLRFQQRLDGLANGLFLAGMLLNSAKCASIYVRALEGHRPILAGMLDELSRAPLKAQQRVSLLKRHLPPKVFLELIQGAVHHIQLQAGVLSTKSRRNRRTGSTDILCRGQCGQRDTLFHVLQCCKLTHQARVWRQNQVMKIQASKLVKRGYKMLLELHIPEGWSFRKPDLVLCAKDGLSVLDIVVTGEDLMEMVYAGKVHHYSTADVKEKLRRILDHPADFPISHEPAILLSRGALHPRIEARLRLLGRSKLHFSDLCLMVVRGSLKAYDVYMRGGSGNVNR